MGNWDKKGLFSLCQLINGRAFKPSEWAEEGLPIVRIENLNNYDAEYNYCNFEVDQKYYVQDGDILISWSGTPGTSFGIFVWIRGPAILNQHIFRSVVREEFLTREFFYYSYQGILDDMIRKSHGGAGLKHITKRDLKEIELCYPMEKAEQAAIVSVLAAIDRSIKQTEKLIAKNTRIKTGLLQDLLTRGIDENGQIRSEKTHKFKDSPLGRIPDGWEVRSMEYLTTQIIDGTHHTPEYCDDGIPFLRVTDIQGDLIDLSQIKWISATEHKMLIKRCCPCKGDILYSKNGTVGIPLLIDWEWEFSIFVSLALIKVNSNRIHASYLEAFLNSPFIKNQIRLRAKQGTVTNLHLEEIREFLVLVPKTDEQSKILETIQKIENPLKLEQQQLDKLLAMKKGLMQDLLTGNVSVEPLLKTEAGQVA